MSKERVAVFATRSFLVFGQFADGLGNGTVGSVGAVFIAAVHFCHFPVFYDDFHHTAGICGAAVATEKNFFFHLICLRDAEAHGSQTQPIRCHGLQIVTQQHSAGGNLPGVTISVYINLNLAAV